MDRSIAIYVFSLCKCAMSLHGAHLFITFSAPFCCIPSFSLFLVRFLWITISAGASPAFDLAENKLVILWILRLFFTSGLLDEARISLAEQLKGISIEFRRTVKGRKLKGQNNQFGQRWAVYTHQVIYEDKEFDSFGAFLSCARTPRVWRVWRSENWLSEF